MYKTRTKGMFNMKIAVLGCGTVGSGVVDLTDELHSVYAARCGENDVEVKYILDLRELKDTPYASRVIHDIDTIVNDPEIDVAVEMMGGTEPAFSFCMKCIEAGKCVVTSNKQLVAEKGEALMEAAKKHDVAFMFGASVCGGIPVIRNIFSSLSSNVIESFSGILNGTTNYILTKMTEEKSSFEAALADAQQKGFAEKDPTDDIEGFDAARKTAILCSACFGTHVYPDEIKTEGITKITLEDVLYLKKAGYAVKLIGRGSKRDGRIYACVAPAALDEREILSGVRGVLNAVFIKGNAMPEMMMSGPGAGKLPTASDVVADILECARLKFKNEPVYSWKKHADGVMGDVDLSEKTFYVRGFANDTEKATVMIREAFGGVRVLGNDRDAKDIAFICECDGRAALGDKLEGIKELVAVSVIPVL